MAQKQEQLLRSSDFLLENTIWMSSKSRFPQASVGHVLSRLQDMLRDRKEARDMRRLALFPGRSMKNHR